MHRFWSVLFWSVIAAAFIGPGTVTAAASAGAAHGYGLLWALSFSTAACLMLQEAAARLTVVSGYDLGQALRRQYHAGVGGLLVLLLVLGAIVLGCAAYEVGNILGGVAGAVLGTDLHPRILTSLSAGVAAALLWLGRPRTVARLTSLFVAVMGLAFLVTAWQLEPAPLELLRGAIRPAFPPGSGLLILGLIGTTVVPYNLFLGSGLAVGQSLPELRFGLGVAVILGGAISMGILVVGTAVGGPFSFEALADVLAERLGRGARMLFAAGLFSAGLSSAITAPLAAAVTARSLFGAGRDDLWHDRSPRFRAVWSAVLLVGLGFGLAQVRPIPAILLAQALNGVLLPLVALFLFLAVNDRRLMGPALNGALANSGMALVTGTTLVLGLAGVARAVTRAFGMPPIDERALWIGSAACSLCLAWPVGRRLQMRRRPTDD